LSAEKPDPTPDQTVVRVASCREFLLQAHAIVARETQQWAAEFQDLLSDLRQASKPRGQSAGSNAQPHCGVD